MNAPMAARETPAASAPVSFVVPLSERSFAADTLEEAALELAGVDLTNVVDDIGDLIDVTGAAVVGLEGLGDRLVLDVAALVRVIVAGSVVSPRDDAAVAGSVRVLCVGRTAPT